MGHPDHSRFLRRGIIVFLQALILAAALGGCGSAAGENSTDWIAPEGKILSNEMAVADRIREGLKAHAEEIIIRFKVPEDVSGILDERVGIWVEDALAETDDPAEGDYLRYQIGGYAYRSTVRQADGLLHYTVTIRPDYYDWYYQAQEADAAAAELTAQFAFDPQTSEAERIESIYRWFCENVAYDKVHRKNPYYHLKSTAYAALVQKNAACQGFCVGLYRLLREEGISCRIVTGSAKGPEGDELHAWVIAAVDGQYYGLDPSWDAGKTEWDWFLTGSEQMKDRISEERFCTEEFLSVYPLAEHAYTASPGHGE